MPATPHAARRHSFDRDPAGYTRARPGYPAAIFDLLAGHGLGADALVLEIGAGTGQATADLLDRGARVVAAEPGANLAATLRERFPTDRLRVVEADIERAELPAGPYDLAFVASALHWVDTAVALPRVAAALRPAGVLAACWTIFSDRTGPLNPYQAALEPLLARYLPPERWGAGDLPEPLRVADWTARLREGGAFDRVDAGTVRWTHRLTTASARRLWASRSAVAALAPADRDAFLDGVTAAVDGLGGE